MTASPIPITIITGFLGSGKTTLILNLVPQLRAANPSYRLALLKNEFGDVAIDSQLASASAVSGVRELLNGCICCNLVGQLGDALGELTSDAANMPDRVVIETSGSAFPATLAMEVNRLAKETGGRYALDGVVSVIDVENWRGYEDTSYTAKVQARYTDLIVYNKWELCDEDRLDEVRDRVGDLEVDIAWVKSRKGWVSADVVFGIDGALAAGFDAKDGGGGHGHSHDHHSEVEVLSVELKGPPGAKVAGKPLMQLLETAPKDEIYRIKAVLAAGEGVKSSDPEPGALEGGRCILNWAFKRWTFTNIDDEASETGGSVLKMTVILARYESNKWKKKIEAGGLVEVEGGQGELVVSRVA